MIFGFIPYILFVTFSTVIIAIYLNKMNKFSGTFI